MRTKVKIGILGGGQLGRMMQEAALPLNIQLQFLDPSPQAPCGIFEKQCIVGNWNDANSVVSFGAECDVIGLEFEDVSIRGLEELQSKGKKCIPSPQVLGIIQDKSKQKAFLRDAGIPTLPFQIVDAATEIQMDFPYILKKAKGGYDGYGVKKINSLGDIPTDWAGPFVVEPLCEIEKEIAVLVARNERGETAVWEPVEMVFNAETHMVERLVSPGNLNPENRQRALDIALDCANKLNATGILAVEMFLSHRGECLVNEMAPRPHNSGHWTIEGAVTSQFEQYVRILSGLPLGRTDSTGYSASLNILGDISADGEADEATLRQRVVEIPFAHLHLYGKKWVKPHRKMGHVTITAKTAKELHAYVSKIPIEALRILSLPSKP